MPTLKFDAFYADGTVCEGGGPGDEMVPVTLMVSRDWLAAPTEGLLYVVVENPYTSRHVLSGADFYFPVGDGDYGMADHLQAWLGGMLPGVVKFGRYVSGKRFVEVLQKVKADARIPRDGPRLPSPFEDIE